MDNLIAITDDVLKKARRDPNFRHQLVSEHLDRLVTAMSRAKETANTDPAAEKKLQEGARLAVKLADILHAMGAKPAA